MKPKTKEAIKDALALVGACTIFVILLCHPFYDRHCDYCGQPTLFIPNGGNSIVAAKESFLDKIINDYAGIETYHVQCLEELKYGR